jgi:hypothetical protein
MVDYLALDLISGYNGYLNHQQLREHLYTFLNAYNFAKHVKTLKVSRPMNTSSNAGKKSLNDLRSIQTIALWD